MIVGTTSVLIVRMGMRMTVVVGSVLIVRDRMHPAPITAPEPPITAPQPPGEPLAPSSAARRSGVSFDGAAAAGSEPLCPARRTRGVQIRGPVFAEDA